MHDEHMETPEKGTSIWYKVGLWGALAIMGYFLITEHRAHVIQFLPFALLLACPFMHMFMHGGHGGHSHGSHNQEQSGHKHDTEQNKESK
jgi:hypothetical protein